MEAALITSMLAVPLKRREQWALRDQCVEVNWKFLGYVTCAIVLLCEREGTEVRCLDTIEEGADDIETPTKHFKATER